MKNKLLFFLSALSVFAFAAQADKELALTCIRHTGTHERIISVYLKVDSLQMTVKLEDGQTIRGFAVETSDHASGRRRYYLEGGGLPYHYELGLILEADENAPAILFLTTGASGFECRKKTPGSLP